MVMQILHISLLERPARQRSVIVLNASASRSRQCNCSVPVNCWRTGKLLSATDYTVLFSALSRCHDYMTRVRSFAIARNRSLELATLPATRFPLQVSRCNAAVRRWNEGTGRAFSNVHVCAAKFSKHSSLV